MTDSDVSMAVPLTTLLLEVRKDLQDFRGEFRVEMRRTDERLNQAVTRGEFESKVVPRVEHESRWRGLEERLQGLEKDHDQERRTVVDWAFVLLPLVVTLILLGLKLAGH